MNRLKRSRAVKIIAFLLILLFVYGALGNTALLYIAYENNMMNVDKAAFDQKVYSYFAEETANKAIRYFYILHDLEQEGDDLSNIGYYESEAKLYSSRFSKEHSNAAFVIKDETGKVLLQNYELKEFAYRYDRTFIYSDGSETPEFERFTVSDQRGGRAEEWTDVTEPAEETTALDYETTTLSLEASSNATGTDEIDTTAEPTTPYAMAATDQQPATVEPELPAEDAANANRYDMDYYMGSGQREYDGRRFLFVFQPSVGMDQKILEFCENDFIAADEQKYATTYNEDYAVYYQDEYASSVNNVVYRLNEAGELRALYEWVNIRNKQEKTYSVSVFVSRDTTANDAYRFAAKLSDFAYGYKDKAIAVTVVFVLLGIALYAFLLTAAGWTTYADGPVCRGWHRIPLDLSCVIFFLLALILFAIGTDLFSGAELPWLLCLLIPAACILFLCFTESLAVRIKTHSIKESLLIIKVFRLLKKGFFLVADNFHILWKVGIYYVVTAILTCLLIVVLHDAPEILLIIYILFKLIELPLLVLCALNVDTLQKGAKDLANGNTNKPVSGLLLFGEFKKQADSLNAINAGINKAVAERMKSESMKTELITNVSHDLKTPLTSIVNYVDLLKKEDVQNPQAKEYIDVIDRQAQRLKKLTTDIVDASKAATGTIPMAPEPTDLGVLLHQVCGEYEDKLKAGGLIPVLSTDGAPCLIYADGKLLWRVFDNLMNNICKYAMAGTRVYLSLSGDGNAAEATFRNISGQPLNISPEELTERFVRGDASRNTEGSGLGLSISKSLTENMGGQFRIDIDGDLFKVTVRFPLLQNGGQAL